MAERYSFRYSDVLIREADFSQNKDYIPANWEKYNLLVSEPNYMFGVANRLLEIAKSSIVSCHSNRAGRLTTEEIAYESVAAHTNLVQAMVDYAVDHIYDDMSRSLYDRRVIREAIRLYDLPKNETGDTDGICKRDEVLTDDRTDYLDRLFGYYDEDELVFVDHVQWLLKSIDSRSCRMGCMIYVAEKIATIIMMLAYETLGMYPHAFPEDESLSETPCEELAMCEKRSPEGGLLLSELRTIDYLYGRELARYDITGFFTALMIMATLVVHGEWYGWRIRQYREQSQ